MNHLWDFIFGVWFTCGWCAVFYWWGKHQDDFSPEEFIKLAEKIENRKAWLRKLNSSQKLWRIAHRNKCYPVRAEGENIFPPELKIIRKEVVSSNIIAVNKTIFNVMGPIEALRYRQWKREESYYRLSCRLCGRLHFRHVSYYSPVDE